VFFLGTKGSGKSTTIHYLGGSEILSTWHNRAKKIAIGQVFN
jgi:hypothetical protein